MTTDSPEPTPEQSMVRLLIADPNGEVFNPSQIQQLLDLERGIVKLAAARALGIIATSEALLAKVIKDGDLATDGAKLAAELRAQAKELRDSHAAEGADGTSEESTSYFGITNIGADATHGPELVNRPPRPMPWGW